MGRRPSSVPGQADLLSWQPPEPVTRFAEERVRAANLAGRVSRGISEALKDAELSRERIAEAMAEFLQEEVPKSMLDAYASQAREGHVINIVRFIALLHATQDPRLLEMIASMFGWAVVDRQFLALIELAQVREREDELHRKGKALRMQARAGGLL